MTEQTKQPKEGFDRELLERPWQERVDSFRRYISNHANLRAAYDQLRSAISVPIPGRIVLVYGPSGVGKTTLREGVQRRIIAEMMPELERDPGRIPIVGVKVEAPDGGNFDWKKFYKSLLVGLDDVLIDRKMSYRVPGVGRDQDGRLSFDKSATKPDLCDAVLSAVEHRRPVAIIADEAQDLGIISSGRKLIDQMNRIKHLADTIKIPFVLAGTYDLLKFRLLNGQLSRRCVEVHFRRYRAELEADVEEFKDILNSFQKRMPLADEPDLVGRWEYFYERTLGCVGILKDWLTFALQASLEKGNVTLRDEFVEGTAPPMASCQKMLDEILEKEKDLAKAEEAENVNNFRARLKLVPSGDGAAGNSPAPAESHSTVGGKRQAVPFKRKAKRDPVGREKIAS
jgi:energy-coupling factor transporter ATP-binding protein EcfA2